MEDKIDSKTILRAWLYQLLAALELAEEVEASKTEGSNCSIELKIQFKV